MVINDFLVLGMVHEHQREHCDAYLDFCCKTLLGMREIVDDYMKNKEVSEEVAWEIPTTTKIVAYIKGNQLNPNAKPHLDGAGGVDMDSVMMCTSSQGTDYVEYEIAVDTAVSVKIHKDENRNKIHPAAD